MPMGDLWRQAISEAERIGEVAWLMTSPPVAQRAVLTRTRGLFWPPWVGPWDQQARSAVAQGFARLIARTAHPTWDLV